MPISEARAAAINTQIRIRGVVTLPPGLIDEQTAVLQDASGAILLRLGEGASRLRLGARVELIGTRSTLSGMESLRVTDSITSLGTGSEPATRSIRTGEAGEADEAKLVEARGAIVASARSSSTGTVYFEIDDGSGPLRVTLSAALRADRGPLVAGTWVEVVGVLGQETSQSKPDEGYRIWPRAASEVRVTAPVDRWRIRRLGRGGPRDGGSGGRRASRPARSTTWGPPTSPGSGSARRSSSVRGRRCGSEGCSGTEPVSSRSHPSSALLVARLTRERRPPFALDLGGLQAMGSEPVTGVPIVRSATAAGQTAVLRDAPAPPRVEFSGDLPAWVSVVGRLAGPPTRRVLVVDGERVPRGRSLSGRRQAAARRFGGRHRSRTRRALCGCSSRAAASDRHRASSQAPRARGSATPRRVPADVRFDRRRRRVGCPPTDRGRPAAVGCGRPRWRRGRRTPTLARR